VDFLAAADVIAGKGKAGIAAIGNDAAAGITFYSAAGRGYAKACADHRAAGDGALVATRVSAGVAAILTSTSLTGWSVQARVT